MCKCLFIRLISIWSYKILIFDDLCKPWKRKCNSWWMHIKSSQKEGMVVYLFNSLFSHLFREDLSSFLLIEQAF